MTFDWKEATFGIAMGANGFALTLSLTRLFMTHGAADAAPATIEIAVASVGLGVLMVGRGILHDRVATLTAERERHIAERDLFLHLVECAKSGTMGVTIEPGQTPGTRH